MRSILCFGEALIDFHAEGRDERGFPRAYVPFAGGAPANVAVAVAKLGGNARFAGMLGTDLFGDLLLDSLRHAGVETRDVARTGEANTALAFVALDAHGDRSFSFYRPPAADLLFRPPHFRADAFADTAIFHVCSNSMTEPDAAETTREGMRRARDTGALVSFDLNLRPALWPRGADVHAQVWPALELADVVKLSAEELAWLAGDDEAGAIRRLWQGHARLLVVTDSARALRWFHPSTAGSLPVYRVPAVDSTAAGDAFVGALLQQLASQQIGPRDLDALVVDPPRLHHLLHYAAAAGALAVTRKGSFTALPDSAEVVAFMEAHA